MLRYLTAGESHGKALIAILEGVPAGLRIEEGKINQELKRRQSGFGRGKRMQIENDTAQIVSGLKNHQEALGFVVLKGGEYMGEIISDLVESVLPYGGNVRSSRQEGKLVHEYHFGGFAKTTLQLINFKEAFEKEFGFELDYIYTAKMFYGIFDLIKKNHFPENTKIVAIHTGGLQGNKGFEK